MLWGAMLSLRAAGACSAGIIIGATGASQPTALKLQSDPPISCGVFARSPALLAQSASSDHWPAARFAALVRYFFASQDDEISFFPLRLRSPTRNSQLRFWDLEGPFLLGSGRHQN